ncbi:energy transducer TonB [Flavilitoribacter nigricans]|uniref:TonB C-terminal domain-containing protein n=1 Tax=Flavilitoribacter nigricans (strain ATCC 23147 / DSM 23189 / NBRC 102662 / NCIMB 1420 / SS-2) TaxID=1122177 RepID=A0A2D0NEX8_FLAN2|nr:energy transducer TonB [Flavilitoribacter nigricans]PHN07052.1 hypothetical protein CRP01_07420 [Flavilitoribacter nigricans DSM 23189 = NBRC 102662]
MNNRDEHIVNSLRRWIQGDIDQKEENRLDRQAREDAFLGEALEGYRQFPGSKHQERLERMREQLQTNTQKRKKRGGVLIALPYRIAAAAAVVLAVGLFWWLNPTQSADLAEAAPTEQTESESAAREMSPRNPENTVTVPEIRNAAGNGPVDDAANIPAPAVQAFADSQEILEEAEMEADESQLLESVTANPARNEVLTKPQDSALALRRSTVEEQAQTRSRVNEDQQLSPIVVPPAPPPANDFAIGGVKLEAPQGTRLVTGQVLDRSGSPLNGVLVVTPGDRTGTITNLNGQYEILLDSNVQKLEFQRTGYSSQRIDIPDSQNFVRVTMDENATTVDQMIAAKEEAKKSKKDKLEPAVNPSSLNLNIAEPAISLRRFERYLRRNLQYPQAAIDQEISGSVTLRFIILPDGRVLDIKAISGPGELYEEAIRLIREGPKWDITNGGDKSITFTYRLDFSL